ncbi:MAG: transglutaminase domain-containing protein [Bacteroidales bacterium]|nr:transglutaminase domain-containing protein [Bacteroidales bacterium]
MQTIKKIAIIFFVVCIALISCKKEKHFISDKEYRNLVHADFMQRKQLASGLTHQLFDGMDTLDCETREALEFLYAYMPYSDLADYDQSFYLQQIKASFAAREYFEWGKKIPEDIFRHFVLVYRVNNENLDTARLLMQRELTPRIKGLSMYDAALEVNHWCHEHVAYRASDGRTSAPLATMKTSLGRCGEESTFAVTALRSVGIPARQCYTPRWAHCDDNHAWVEVFIADSNKWYFLGACEPDAELDMGWFAVPSTRCMMVHSKAFGRYNGDEEVVKETALYSELNLLNHYAPTKKVTITVYNSDNQPVEGADVKFKLYNYSEFFPLATIKTDKQGKASLTTGHGDLQIWASDGNKYNYIMLDIRKTAEGEIYLTRNVDTQSENYVENIDVVPPVAGVAKVTPCKKKADANAKRLVYEDSVRADYVASFPTREKCSNYNDREWAFIHNSEGNHHAIRLFIDKHKDNTALVYDYLSSYSDKDLRDIEEETLEAHITPIDNKIPYDVYKKGILPARISNEMVRPWRVFLANELKQIKNANELITWTKENILVDDTGNYYNCPISPCGVYKLKHSDKHSRDIFFVAACRSLNIPSYLDNATNTIYVYDNMNTGEKPEWRTISFELQNAIQPSASLTLTFKSTKELAKPIYWSHFSLAKYENGDFNTFDFEDDSRMYQFPATITLEPGYYCLTTGNRYSEGDVLARAEYFVVSEGEKVTKEIILRPLKSRLNEAQATIDPTQEIVPDMATVADYAGATGVLFIFVGDYKEPSKHLIKELQSLTNEYSAWGGMTYLVAPASAKPITWKLPNTDCIIRDASDKDPFEKQIVDALKLNLNNDYPLVALVNNHGEIMFHSHGYSIGLAEQILKHL